MSGSSDPQYYGDLWADVYDREHAGMDPTIAVELLADLAGERRVLELGIGTGRIAIPLRERGVHVLGIDASEAMVERLRAKPHGAEIDVTIGDMATAWLGGLYGLVFVAFNTFFSLLTQQRQIDCFRNVAQALEPGGQFVLECFVPDVARFRDGNQTVRVVGFEETRVRLNASVHDSVAQTVSTQVVMFAEDGSWVRPVSLRYAWPAELDLMANIAGLELVERWAGWSREPFTAKATQHISVYKKLSS